MARFTTACNILSIASSHLRTFSVKLSHIPYCQWLSVTLIGLLAFGGSAAVGLVFGVSEPKSHDEFSYLLAADTFAHGRLTNPTHPMWMHFESFHIIQQPTYMSKYPPAQGLVLAAGQILGGHPTVGVWMSMGLMCAAICWMLYAWVAPRWAVLGGILALINPTLGIGSYWAQSYWGGALPATGGALVLGGVRRLMRQPRVRDALLTGVGLAILANSRPYEGLLVSLPAGAFLLVWMLSKRGPAMWVSIRLIVMPILMVLVLTATAMGLYNLRVTGNALRMPYQVHEETYAMAPLFIWQKSRPEPRYNHPVIRDFHKTHNLSLYDQQRSIGGFIAKNLSLLLVLFFGTVNIFAIPLIGMLTVLVPWTLRNSWATRAVVIYFIITAGVILETFIGLHYFASITGLNLFFVLNAMRLWRWRNRRVGQVMLWLVPLLAVILLWSYAAVKPGNSSAWPMQRVRLLKQLKQEEGKHLIIVSYGPRHSLHHEWVYNEANIDEAKVVWARQIDTDQNCKLVKYFRHRNIWSLAIDGDESIPELSPYPTNLCQVG